MGPVQRGVGLPLAAAVQSSALFLPYILLLALPHGALLLVIALQVTGGVAIHALLRSLGVGTVASLAGGVLFEMNSTYSWLGPVSALPVAFLPLLLLLIGLERARAAAVAGRPGGYRLIAVALALSLYAGFPETAYLDGLLALAWAGTRLATLGRPCRLGYAGRVAGGGAVGMMLALPLLWLLFHLMGVSSLGGRESIAIGLLSTPPAGLPLFLLPDLFGLPADLSAIEPSGLLTEIWNRTGGYLGGTLALAALLGLVCCGRRELGLRVLLGAWIAVTLAKSMDVPGVTGAVNLVPFLHEVAFARYSGGGRLRVAGQACRRLRPRRRRGSAVHGRAAVRRAPAAAGHRGDPVPPGQYRPAQVRDPGSVPAELRRDVRRRVGEPQLPAGSCPRAWCRRRPPGRFWIGLGCHTQPRPEDHHDDRPRDCASRTAGERRGCERAA